MKLLDLLKRLRQVIGAAIDPAQQPAAPAAAVSVPPPAAFEVAAAPVVETPPTSIDLDVDVVPLVMEPELPVRSGPERRVEAARVNARPGTRALIIDDSPTIVALLGRMLRQNGITTIEAFDAESGIEIALREVPDLVFLDIVLPGMDGFSALRILRRDPRTKAMPIIMISGNAQATEQFYVQRIGADDFMKKPFSRAEVFARIERLLDADCAPARAATAAASRLAMA
jgi:CheY-like chemotaxis protein